MAIGASDLRISGSLESMESGHVLLRTTNGPRHCPFPGPGGVDQHMRDINNLYSLLELWLAQAHLPMFQCHLSNGVRTMNLGGWNKHWSLRSLGVLLTNKDRLNVRRQRSATPTCMPACRSCIVQRYMFCHSST